MDKRGAERFRVTSVLLAVVLVLTTAMAVLVFSGQSSVESVASAAPLMGSDDNVFDNDGGGDDSAVDNGFDNDGDDNGDNGVTVTSPTSTPTAVPGATPTATPVPVPVPVAPAPVPAPVVAGPCTFQLGFLDFKQTAGAFVGECVGNEFGQPNGDTLQFTRRADGTLVTLVWDKATNTRRGTDGFRTITYSGCGLQERLNVQSFAWERNPALIQAPPPPGSCEIV